MNKSEWCAQHFVVKQEALDQVLPRIEAEQRTSMPGLPSTLFSNKLQTRGQMVPTQSDDQV